MNSLIWTDPPIANRDPSKFEMNKYIEEGMKSFRKNKCRYKNPYKPGSDPYNNFERGWTQALKRTPDQFFNRFKT
jgi:hypothetical protein